MFTKIQNVNAVINICAFIRIGRSLERKKESLQLVVTLNDQFIGLGSLRKGRARVRAMNVFSVGHTIFINGGAARSWRESKIALMR